MGVERALVSAGLAFAVAVLTGCGAAAGGTTAAVPPAQPLAAQAPTSAKIQRFTPADFRRPISRYRRLVDRGLRTAERRVRMLRGAVARGALREAQDAWRAADAAYATIGAAYGAFGRLDAAVDVRAAGLPLQVRDPRFTGLHRVELALFGRRSTTDARLPAAILARDLRRMRRAVPTLHITALDYARRAHEILEDALHLQLTGVASPWSGDAFDVVAANVAGTRAILRTLRPLLDRQARVRRIRADRDLRAIQRAIHGLPRTRGRLPTLRTAAPADRRLIAARVAAATESLAYVPEVIDPRPPRPVRSPYATAP